MIEELKSILDLFGKLPNFTLEILGGFALYKIIIYLSTSGSIVYIGKLLILKLHDAYIRPKPPVENIFRFKDVTMCGASEQDVLDILTDLARNGASVNASKTLNSPQAAGLYWRGNYIHSSDTQWLKDAFREKIAKDGYPK